MHLQVNGLRLKVVSSGAGVLLSSIETSSFQLHVLLCLRCAFQCLSLRIVGIFLTLTHKCHGAGQLAFIGQHSAARATAVDLATCNAVVHIISALLLP